MSAAIKVEHDKVNKAFSQIISKLSLDINIISRPMSSGKLKRYSKTYFTIERSNRDKQDRKSFVVYFNQDIISTLNLAQTKRHAWHEILHAITWAFVDEFEEVVKYLKDQPDLYGELVSRAYDTRENVIYNLERCLGPVVLPESDWSEEGD
jgi:phage regulator Rha-like protein